MQVTRGQLQRPHPATISGFSIDSRTIKPGEIFVALKGERTDGHLFLEEAFQRGASGAIISRRVEAPGLFNLIEVEDTLAALQALARAYRRSFRIPIVGVTGSSGKTTTKELLFSILSRRFRAYRSPGNYNTEYGLPLALLAMPKEAEVGVFELGLQRPGDIGRLAELLEPMVGIITAIGEAHLGFFQSIEELAENKWALIARLPRDGLAVVNRDSAYLQARRPPARVRTVGFGLEAEAEYRASEVDDTSLEGLRLTLETPQGSFPIRSRLLGRLNAYNILAAAAAALELGASPDDAQRAVVEFRPVPHRMELRRSRVGLVLDDSYNANPTAVKEALRALSRLKASHRKILVLGDMLELGDRAVEAHRELAEAIIRADVELVFTVGELAAETGKALLERGWGERVVLTHSLDELREALLARLEEGQNLILVKGSRAMGLDRFVDGLSPSL
ncbi:MAG: UDP-N-acetylmuramoyl-tripeptide--D-alanyl-D-alanine ligase [Candidatus Acetothermia bacterium]|nr:UDP-N-acetylmuramoyl-tripeptide--D-alanyl-D-alanine ligase [Candidatus Acetothermia bacterium]MDH7505917.1 UDP-N-acetylmuramoyl-tripeptide--D-alanyl-D-alanine ligase [Candidatus Acetothermia bacterium]